MKEHILIIDDDLGIRALLQFYLSKHYHVTTKANGLEAMLWLEKGNFPDMILVDANMPKVDGYDFLKLVRSSGFFQSIPVLVLTGSCEIDVREKFYQAGANGFMTKPFNPSKLLQEVMLLLSDTLAFTTLSNAEIK